MTSQPTTTDGWRGLPGPGWSEREVLAVLHGVLPALLSGQDRGADVLVGHDGRAGSRELAGLAADWLAGRGTSCRLATGPAPTPALGRMVHEDGGLAAAVVMTASHNPPGFFGLKVRDSAGYGVVWPPAAVEAGAAPEPAGVAVRAHRAVDAAAAYARGAVGRALLAGARRFGGRLVVDAAHGAVGALAPHLPGLAFHRARPLPFFAGATPDPTLRQQAEAVAERVLAGLPDAGRGLVAMVDGDGDRLALFTRRSRFIGSAEQAALLLRAGLPARRLITTAVAPLMVARAVAADRPDVEVTETAVGFKHIVAAWRSDPRPALGLEPNGALVWPGPDGAGYFERDSLAALGTLLAAFPAVADLDDAVTALRGDHPYRQDIHTVALEPEEVVARVARLLPGWHAAAVEDRWVFGDGGHGRITVRRAATEPRTRLYVEAEPAVGARLPAALRAARN
ncbi:hypothetical protein [Actinacidiphila sp. bgisy145]|uniref:hypothetical protein n=1 Tax=Actinacidiphila sp. bgisy145 TaxID=3413792 RepID=UPI003EB8395B